MNDKHVVVLYASGKDRDDLGNLYGCHFMILPAIRAFRKIFKGKLTILTDKQIGDLVFSDIDCTVCDIHYLSLNYVRGFDLNKIKSEIHDCSLFICLNSWEGNATGNLRNLLAFLTPDFSIGFYSYFSKRINYNNSIHYCDLIFNFVKYFEPFFYIEDFIQRPALPLSASKLVETLVESIHLSGGKALTIAVSTQVPGKRWPLEHYRQALSETLKKFENLGVIIISNEKIIIDELFQEQVIAIPDISFSVAWALIGLADFFLGIESDYLHIADMYQKPGVGLFGMLSPVDRAGFRFSQNASLVSDSVDLSSITPIEVELALEKMLTYPTADFLTNS